MKAILMCPYKMGCWDEEYFENDVVPVVGRRIWNYPASLTIIYGTRDFWPPSNSFVARSEDVEQAECH